MDLNKHIVKDDNDKNIHHSNGYAKIANGNRIGSVGNVSFEQRLKIERNRQTIASYHRSSIGQSYGALRAKSIGADRLDRSKINTRPSVQAPINKSAGLPRRFSEPSAPKYNPYT